MIIGFSPIGDRLLRRKSPGRPTGCSSIGPNRALAATVATICLIAIIHGNSWAQENDHIELEKTAQAYFEAEIKQDTERVWEMIAPSSKYKKDHTYEMFLAMVKKSTIKIKKFKIEKVVEIESNKDQERMPLVTDIGYVRVFVIIGGPGFRDSERHVTMTFLKEGGKWYKG